MIQMTQDGRMPLTKTDVERLNRLEHQIDPGETIKAEIKTQAEIFALYFTTLVAGGVPPELAEALTRQLHDHVPGDKLWMRRYEPAV